LVKCLQDPSRGVREAAGEALVAIGSITAVDALIPLLHSDSPGLRNLAIEILVRLGAKALPSVAELIHDPDPDVRKFAADILGAIKLAEGVPVLIRLLGDPDPNVLQAAVEALGGMGDRTVVPHILALLATPGPHWYHAIEALGRIGDPTAVPVLLAGLESADPISAVGILDTVGQLGDRRAYEKLLLLTQQVGPPVSDGPNRLKAAALFRALLRLGSHLGLSAPPLPPSLVLPCIDAALTDGDREVVELALAAYEENIPPAWAPRILALADGDSVDDLITHVVGLCRRLPSIIVSSLQACPTLWRPILLEGLIEPPTHPVVDALLTGLNEGAFGGQAELVQALGKTGDARVIPTLLTLLEAGDDWLRSRTAEALAKLGAEEAVSPLCRLLRQGGEEADLRAYFHALFVIAPEVLKQELPSLLTHDDIRVRRVATESFEPFGHDASMLLPLLQDPDAQVRRNTVLVLAQHFPSSRDALFLALTDEEATVRRAAVRAVAALGPEKCLALLESAYHQEMDPLVRYEVVVCLRDLIGVPAKALLTAALHDDAPLVRIAAARAFGVSGDPRDPSVRRQLEDREDPELIAFLKGYSSVERA
jgi:HEAT repeat protein